MELTAGGNLTFRDATSGQATARMAVGGAKNLDFTRGRLVGIGPEGAFLSAGAGEKSLTTVMPSGVSAVAVDPVKPERVAIGGSHPGSNLTPSTRRSICKWFAVPP